MWPDPGWSLDGCVDYKMNLLCRVGHRQGRGYSGEAAARARIAGNCAANADRASTTPAPASRPALIASMLVWPAYARMGSDSPCGVARSRRMAADASIVSV